MMPSTVWVVAPVRVDVINMQVLKDRIKLFLNYLMK